MLELETIGHLVWESFTLLMVLCGGMGLVALRRKANGRHGFSNEDRHLFFGHARLHTCAPRMLLKVVSAAVLCFCGLLLEVVFFSSVGAALLTVIMLVTAMGIVNRVIYQGTGDSLRAPL